MPRGRKAARTSPRTDTAATLGFEAKLWQAADARDGDEPDLLRIGDYHRDPLLAVLPDAPGDRRFRTRSVAPIFRGILARTNESRTLAAIRDALLPKLVSGEIRIKDAERVVGQAL